VKKMRKKNIFFSQENYHAFARVAKKLRGKDFIKADSYAARDMICRVFASECFELAKKLKKEGQNKLALQYTKLASKLLGLSLRPKKLSDLEEIKKALERLKDEGMR